MWLFDSIKNRVKKWTDTVIDTTAKVGNFMEEKSATLIEKVPGGHEFKEKASVYTEKTVDRIWTETKEMIKEWHEFVDSHMKKAETPTTEATTATPTPVAEVATIPEVKTEVVEETHDTHKKEVEKKAHTTKKPHTHTKK